MTMEITLVERTPELDSFGANILLQYNEDHTNHGVEKPFCFEIKLDGQRAGVAKGLISHRWLKLDVLAIDKKFRGLGLASSFLNHIEGHARESDCYGVSLTTASFQAPDFYKKHGYEEFARLEPYSDFKHACVYMKKVLKKV